MMAPGGPYKRGPTILYMYINTFLTFLYIYILYPYIKFVHVLVSLYNGMAFFNNNFHSRNLAHLHFVLPESMSSILHSHNSFPSSVPVNPSVVSPSTLDTDSITLKSSCLILPIYFSEKYNARIRGCHKWHGICGFFFSQIP